jgi:hypothetical protein
LKSFRWVHVFAALLAVPFALAVASDAGRCAEISAPSSAHAPSAQQFYTHVLGHWVGTTVSRLNGDPPVTGYFHLVVTRVGENTFQEEYTFYRVHPKTGALERSGTQLDLSTIDSTGMVHRSCKGSGTILIDFKPKNQAFEATGEAHFSGSDRLEAEVKGKIAVDGMPLNLGKNGKLRKATASWALEDGKLVGQTHVETSFRALLFTKRYRVETELRAQRGTSVQLVAGRSPAS